MTRKSSKRGEPRPPEPGISGKWVFDTVSPDPSKTEEDWKRLQHSLKAYGEKAQPALRTKAGIRRIKWFRPAAVLALLITAFGVYFFMNNSLTTYSTDYGERQKVSLPDGSSVMLNARSELRFSRNWDTDGDREVWLSGEAYFKVEPKTGADGKRKFTVHTPLADIQVLGTRFNVRRRSDSTQVTLTSGKVKVILPGKENRAVMLDPGEQAVCYQGSPSIVKRQVSPRQYHAWKDGKLILNDKTLEQVADVLEETFGKKTRFTAGHLKNIRLSGSYPLDDLAKLLHALEIAAQISILNNDKEIVFSP